MIRRTEEQYAAHKKRVKPKIEVTGYLYTKAEDKALLTAINKEIAKLDFKLPNKRTTVAQERRGSVRRSELSLPWPPSVNHYWRRNKGPGMHISAEGQHFRTNVAMASGGTAGVYGRVAVQVIAYPPDLRARDLDNLLKSLLDALQHAGMIESDALIDDLHITRSERVPGGRVDVVITAMP